ncbi:hypothetical protein [Aquimarina megaterium]|uniref:hypothetical protein n=1 Tax=Aquimarina megaterium TaxID=1443666 RepID=UPI00094489CA|nr:hypothetical protein [Aquimarina megaterium]
MKTKITKNPDRVNRLYQKGTEDWEHQFNMLLPDGKTCSDCIYANRCLTLFGQKIRNTSCQFHPNRYSEKP